MLKGVKCIYGYTDIIPECIQIIKNTVTGVKSAYLYFCVQYLWKTCLRCPIMSSTDTFSLKLVFYTWLTIKELFSSK